MHEKKWSFFIEKIFAQQKNEFSDIWILIGILRRLLLHHVFASNPLVDLVDRTRLGATVGIFVVVCVFTSKICVRKCGKRRPEDDPSQT